MFRLQEFRDKGFRVKRILGLKDFRELGFEGSRIFRVKRFWG